jgi:uncharacterized protein
MASPVDSSDQLRCRNTRLGRLGLLVPVAMLALMQCAHSDGPQVAILAAGNQPRATVNVELAQTGPERERGLMYRSELAADSGMLFIFPAPFHATFWMHNTQIPLDMIFAAADRRVIGIIPNAEPYSDAQLAVAGDSQYVLEVNGGFCKRHGVRVGDRLEFLDFTAHPVQ